MLEVPIHIDRITHDKNPLYYAKLVAIDVSVRKRVTDKRILTILSRKKLGELRFEGTLERQCTKEPGPNPYGCYDPGYIRVRGGLDTSEFRRDSHECGLVTPEYGTTEDHAMGLALVHEVGHFIEDPSIGILTPEEDTELRQIVTERTEGVTCRAAEMSSEYFPETLVVATMLPKLRKRDPIGVSKVDSLLTRLAQRIAREQ